VALHIACDVENVFHCGCTIDAIKSELFVRNKSVDEIGMLVFEGANQPQNITLVTPKDSVAWEYAVTVGIKPTTHE
jgi:hypothetical protein